MYSVHRGWLAKPYVAAVKWGRALPACVSSADLEIAEQETHSHSGNQRRLSTNSNISGVEALELYY